MTNIPIAPCASNFNEADPLSTDAKPHCLLQQKVRARTTRGNVRAKKQTPKPHTLTAEDWPAIANEIASWHQSDLSSLLQKERATAIMRRTQLSGCAWWVATWWFEKLNRKTGSDWHGLQAIADDSGYCLKAVRDAVKVLEMYGFILRRKKAPSWFRRKGDNDRWETTFPVLVWADRELKAEAEARKKTANAPCEKKTSRAADTVGPERSFPPVIEKFSAVNTAKKEPFLPPIPTSLKPHTLNPQRASAPGAGVFDCSRTEQPISDTGPGQWTIRETDTSQWKSWMKRFERESPEIADAAKARGAIEVLGSKWADKGQFHRIAPYPMKRPSLRKPAPIATGSDAGAAA